MDQERRHSELSSDSSRGDTTTDAQRLRSLRSRRSTGGGAGMPRRESPAPTSGPVSEAPTWMVQAGTDDPSQIYFPCPLISFLVDEQHPRPVCQICRESRLQLPDGPPQPPEPDVDTTFAILPCGHVAGSVCLRTWCMQNAFCPFCRQSLRHSACGHRVRPGLLTRETIRTIPRILPEGGAIAPLCSWCRWDAARDVVDPLFVSAAARFRRLRRDLGRTRDWAEQRAMMVQLRRMRDDMERMLMDGFHVEHLVSRPTTW